MQITIYSDSPQCTTGFAVVADKIVDAVIQAGHTPVVVGLKVGRAPDPYKCEIYHPAATGDPDGMDTLEAVIRKTGSKMLVTVADPWTLEYMPELKERIGFYWIGYNPVEGTPYPRKIKTRYNPPEFCEPIKILQAQDVRLAYTKMGADAIKRVTGKPCESIPHGVDCDFFTPEKTGREKELLGLGKDDFLFTVVKANTERAGLDIMLQAWEVYMECHKEKNHYLYLHTDPSGVGVNLYDLFEDMHLPNVIYDKSVRLGGGVSRERLRDIYRATDIFVNPAKAEGWGLTVLEAMACGVPCIISDYGAPAEWSDGAASTVPLAGYYRPMAGTCDYGILDVRVLREKMHALAYAKISKVDRAERGRVVAEKYPWSRFVRSFAEQINAVADIADKKRLSTIKWGYV